MNQPMPGGSCPVALDATTCVTLVHGEGGRAMRRMIRDRIVAKLAVDSVQMDADAADVGALSGNIAMTTDSFVVSPMFFPGGDIGSLAVFGTVNDLAMAGAVPRFMTLALIVEEGVSWETLDRIMTSVANAANDCGIKIVAGDTKVVPKGAADGVYINTTGIGQLTTPRIVGASSIAEGDSLIVSGPIGQHGLAVMCEREALGISPPPLSDSAPLHRVAHALHVRLGIDLRAMRDATRGGIAAVMHEWAHDCGRTIWIDESAIPLTPSSRGICEILGLDPMFIANEGTFVVAVASHRCEHALGVLRQFRSTRECAIVGKVRTASNTPVIVRRGIGIDQPLDEPSGALLPRIC